ncbi:MAG: ornithine cyclodeaminase [Bacteroidetes bacterium]|nr:ornithine cyclodeaminase [Bacteroidota bacterium]
MKDQNIRQPIVLIKSSEIRDNFTMPEAIEAMEEAYISLSSGKSYVPQRYVTSMAGGAINMLLKPVAVDSLNRAAIKILTQKEKGVVRGIPAIVGIVLVLDTETGEILSIMDGEYLTALRTGAASGLATRYFARENANTLAIFGCGAQGKTQLEAVAAVREISKVWIFDRNKGKAKSFISELENKMDAEIHIAEDNEVLKECDVICTATNAEEPLFKLDELKEGVHINAIGSYKPNMQELDPFLIKKAKVYVDQKGPCLAESGDLIKPIKAGLIAADHIQGEIGDFALNRIEGRTSEKEITVFKSVGVAIQDFVVANKVYEKSITQGFGQKISLFD